MADSDFKEDYSPLKPFKSSGFSDFDHETLKEGRARLRISLTRAMYQGYSFEEWKNNKDIKDFAEKFCLDDELDHFQAVYNMKND